MMKINQDKAHQTIEASKQYLISNPNQTIEMLKPVLEQIERDEILNHQDIFNAYNNYGSACFVNTNIDDAITYFDKALQHLKTYLPEDKYNTVKVYHSLGLAYANLNALETSLEYYFLALQVDVPKLKPNLLNNIAFVYSANFDYKRALSYFELAVIEAEQQENDELKTGSLLNAASCLIEFDNTGLARKKLDEAFSLLEGKLKDIPNMYPMLVHAHTHLGRIFYKEKNSEKGKFHLDKAVDLANNKVKQIRLVCIASGYKAIALLENQEIKKGIELADEILTLSKKYKLNTIRAYVLANLVKNLEVAGELTLAYKYMKEQLEDTQEVLYSSRNANFWKIMNRQEKEMEASLQSKNEKEYNAFVDQLTHILSHDLKEPLRNITSFSNLLEKRYGTELGEEGKEFMNFIASGANQMSRNLVRLLEYTTLNSIDKKEVRPIPLQTIIPTIKEQFSNEYPAINLSIDFDTTSTIRMSQNHAFMLLEELVSNAIKFRGEGENCDVAIHIKEQDGNAYITITDQGMGIEEPYIARTFKIFNKLNRNIPGEGVGLSICEKLVKLYGGQIWITSIPEQSTTIHINLPLL